MPLETIKVNENSKINNTISNEFEIAPNNKNMDYLMLKEGPGPRLKKKFKNYEEKTFNEERYYEI